MATSGLLILRPRLTVGQDTVTAIPTALMTEKMQKG